MISIARQMTTYLSARGVRMQNIGAFLLYSLQSTMVIQYQCVLVTQLWSEEMGEGEAPGSCVHFLHVLCSEKLPIN